MRNLKRCDLGVMVNRSCRETGLIFIRKSGLVLLAIAFSVLLLMGGTEPISLQNAGFESQTVGEFWKVDESEAKQNFSISVDHSEKKEGQQSLLISAEKPVHVTLRQELFLPVGTLWRVTGFVKSQASAVTPSADPYSDTLSPGPRIGIEAEVGTQGFGDNSVKEGGWQQASLVFRVPPPGRMTVAINALNNQSGKVWIDDIRLERVPEASDTESVTISEERLSKRPIDLKQGGQFMEPLCDVLPSMTAQQVQSTSFEEETPWTYSYKAAIDKPYRPWYPDGTVHAATYSFDSDNPFNGKRSQKIELPLAHTWAGISQDGFYLEAGHGYRLRMHMRGHGNVPVRASLHGEGGAVAGPVSLGNSADDWKLADVVLPAKRTIRNATLTIEFEGPGTLWLDRVYLIDTNAVLGLWRPDVVEAMKATNPGIVRFGGSVVETFEWSDQLGSWDKRAPYPDDPWGGLQENFVGVEEFVKLVQHVGAEPLICLRWTARTPQDAANQVEYFNGSPDTKWGKMRAENGHRKPYRVKYWEVGNEVGGAEYDNSLPAFSEAMRRIDPSIKILTSYPSRSTVRIAGAAIDYLSPHEYSVGDLNGTENDLKQLQEKIQHDANGKDIRVSVTEWNANGGDWGLRRGMLHTLGNAIVGSRFQNMMHRYSDLVEIANVSNFSHSFAGGQVQPGPGYLYEIPDYSANILYQRAAGSFPLKVERGSSLSFYLREPDLDATLSADGATLRIYGVNSTPDLRKVNFALPPGLGPVRSAKAFVLSDTQDVPDSEAMNSPDDPHRVAIRNKDIAASGSKFEFGFTPFSVSLLEIQLSKK